MELRKFLSIVNATLFGQPAYIRGNIESARRRFDLIRLSWVALLVLAAICSSAPASATSAGISGFSGKSGSTCTVCHSQSTTNIPTVTLTGPTTVTSGSTTTYTLSVSTITNVYRRHRHPGPEWGNRTYRTEQHSYLDLQLDGSYRNGHDHGHPLCGCD